MVALANEVVRRVLKRAVGDPASRSALLNNPNEVMKDEFARAGVSVPDIRFEAVDETEHMVVVRVPISKAERALQTALAPLFQFVDSASESEVDAFVRDPKPRLEKLFGVELEAGVRYEVRIESPGVRVLVIPRDDFGAIAPKGEAAAPSEAKIKLCPKGCTIVTDPCPRGCTVATQCDCTISSTVATTDFPTIVHTDTSEAADGPSTPDAKKLSDLID